MSGLSSPVSVVTFIAGYLLLSILLVRHQKVSRKGISLQGVSPKATGNLLEIKWGRTL